MKEYKRRLFLADSQLSIGSNHSTCNLPTSSTKEHHLGGNMYVPFQNLLRRHRRRSRRSISKAVHPDKRAAEWTAVLNSHAWPQQLPCLSQLPHCFCSMHICGDSDISPGMITSPALLGVPSSLPFSFLSFPLNCPISYSDGDSSLQGHLRLLHSLATVQEHFLF